MPHSLPAFPTESPTPTGAPVPAESAKTGLLDLLLTELTISRKPKFCFEGDENNSPELMFPEVREDVHVIEVAVDGVQVLQDRT